MIVDLISRLDTLALDIGKHHDHDSMMAANLTFMTYLARDWPALRVELLAARAVCETVAGYTIADNRDGLLSKLEAWRLSQEATK